MFSFTVSIWFHVCLSVCLSSLADRCWLRHCRKHHIHNRHIRLQVEYNVIICNILCSQMSVIFRLCIFRPRNLVCHFTVLHFSAFIILCSVILKFCIFSAPGCNFGNKTHSVKL